MNTPSIKKIRAAFPFLELAQAKQVKAIFNGTAELEQPGGSHPRYSRLDLELHNLDIILEGFGVEYAASVEDDFNYYAGVEYINMGDTYSMTILFDRDKRRWIVSTLGGVVESNMKRFS